jgi:hypothetical protein
MKWEEIMNVEVGKRCEESDFHLPEGNICH